MEITYSADRIQEERRLMHDGDTVFLRDDTGDWRELYGDVLPEDAERVMEGGEFAVQSWERIRASCGLGSAVNIPLVNRL